MRLSNKGLICEPPCAPPLSATYASASIGSFSKRQETRPVHLERQHAREPFAPVNCLLWGQTRKSGDAIATSALPPTTDIPASGCDVRKVPTTDISRWVYPVKNAFGLSSDPSYSIQSVGLRAMPQKPPSRIERRLSAILAADVAGYSRLMHSDEEATHTKLTALLADASSPQSPNTAAAS